MLRKAFQKNRKRPVTVILNHNCVFPLEAHAVTDDCPDTRHRFSFFGPNVPQSPKFLSIFRTGLFVSLSFTN